MNSNDHGRPPQSQPTTLQLVEPKPKGVTRRHGKAIEAYHIAEPVRDMIACEFRVVKSSRRLARKYKLPVHVIFDILHLALRKEVQSQRLMLVQRQVA